MRTFNLKHQKEVRKKLRKEATVFEVILWSRLQKRQCSGFKFIRQFGIGGYVVDFYCPAKRLVIELDGSHHATIEQAEYDKERTDYLGSLEIKVLRFWNSEVNNNFEGVVEKILDHL